MLADPNAMQQILANLVQNALKFTPAGGKVVVLRHQAVDEALLERGEERRVEGCVPGVDAR